MRIKAAVGWAPGTWRPKTKFQGFPDDATIRIGIDPIMMINNNSDKQDRGLEGTRMEKLVTVLFLLLLLLLLCSDELR